jgi:hypothetical protein
MAHGSQLSRRTTETTFMTESPDHPSPTSWVLVALAWLAVGLPLLWGIWVTFRKAIPLFQ